MHISEDIIVLHRYPFSESSWIVKAWGQKNGLISFIAKGAKRPKNVWSSYLEPLNYCQVVYISKEGRDLHTLTETSLENNFPEMRMDLESQALGLVLAEIILKTSETQFEAENIYRLLSSYLRLLNSENFTKPRKQYVLSRFLHDYTQLLGFGLQLNNCMECGQKIAALGDGRNLSASDISLTNGGVICMECNHHSSMSLKTVNLIISQAINSFEIIDDFSQNELEKFFLRYLTTHISPNLKLKSLEYLQSVRNLT